MRKIFISGITGFIGQNLNEYLNAVYDITGVSRKHSDSVITYEKLNELGMNDALAFIHLAGKAHDLKNVSSNQEYYDVNTELTKTVFENFLNSTCEVFIYFSSVKACTDIVDGVLDESKKPNPVSVYGKSKLAAEEYILSKKIPSSKRVYILRPCMVHGPGNKGNLNLLFKMISKGIPYPLGRYLNKRSFVSIENLMFIINELLQNSNIRSGIYNIADDEPISTIDIINEMGVVLGKRVYIMRLPKGLIKLIVRVNDLLSLPLTSERLEKLTENYCVSNKKIRNAMKKELPLNSKEGISITLNSFKI